MKKSILALVMLSLASFSTLGNVANAEEIVSDELGTEQSIDINDPTSQVSEILTFEEITEEIASDLEISITEAQELVVDNSVTQSRMSAQAATYRTLSQQFTVTSSYKPTMRFYCQTSESGSFHGILKIMNVNMIRGYNGVTKQFSGTVYVNLERSDKIFYIVNGDFYNNGTTTVNTGVSIGVGKQASINFGVSKSSNHYKYRYVESYYNW
ncbi:hypothetical protein [Carnobacterium sp. FSL W8-0810]|uniref:hypothetical protein n=1 Tax=Carnobacterium sp. FSL W8-0810 TaxID=2954705 RepID=UPI0030F7EB31